MKAALLVLAVCASAPAIADDEIARGAIVKIEAQEIYVNIGADRGVAGGASLRIKRPIALRHPVTRAQVQDWIPIGSANVTQAGAVMSRAVVGEMISAVKVGDVAEVLVDRPDKPAPPTRKEEGPPIDPATAEVLGVFTAQSGQTLDVRIAAWERFLSMRANSPYAEAIRRDLEQLHTLRDELRTRASSSNGDVLVRVAHHPQTRVDAGKQVPLVFVVTEPERVASAYVHFRTRGDRTYRSALLVREHDIYLRGTLPREVVKQPGLDYFVEVSTPQGRTGLALGSPTEPIAVEVKGPTLLDRFGSLPGRSSVKLTADYLDFATFDTRSGDRTDRMITGNVDFTYRLDSAIESLGVGYGVYAGSGGMANEVWDAANPLPRSGFHYGYADIEVGGHLQGVHVSAGGQLIAGVGIDGFGMGAEGRVRVGDRDQTNLAIIGRTISQVGFISDVKLSARPVDALLVGVSVGATDQPNQGDVGVKLGTELELMAIESVSLILRGSWQGRTTQHGGVGAGAGVGFYW